MTRAASSLGSPAIPPRFVIRRPVGRGASGVVYEALDREIDSVVALKILSHATPRMVQRLRAEARMLSDIRHQNVIDVHALHEHEGTWFMAMELVAGLDLVSFCRSAEVEPLAPSSRLSATISECSHDDPNIDDWSRFGAPIRGIEPASGGWRVDEARVREVFAQLFEGLATLHAAGLLHRDIKPSNVLVDGGRGGVRVVVLDLGLAAARDDAGLVGSFAGTPAYAAPEQLVGEPLTEACDVYAAGVMLYEVLTGRLPYAPAEDGAIALRKRQWDPPLVAELAPGTPADLAVLCGELLTRDPRQRPAAEGLAARLRGTALFEAPPSSRELFIGREAELGVLDQAVATAGAGLASAVLVVGPSGIGKSALLGELMRRHREQAWVLHGRCYAHERTAYRGIDGLVAGLARWLESSPEEAHQASGAPGIAALARMFPMLATVLAPTEAPADHATPAEHRRQALGALRELVTRAARTRAVLVVVDDAQWLDDDGVELIAEVFASEIPGCVLLVGVRSNPADPWRELGIARGLPWARDLELGPLDPVECVALARRLSRFDARSDADVVRLAGEAGGVPRVLREVVIVGDGASLGEMIRARISALSEPARRTLGAVALSSRPIRRGVLVRHFGGAEEPIAGLRELKIARLVRATQHLGAERVDMFDDVARSETLARLDEEARRSLHASLASALEADARADEMGERVHHLAESGELGLAAELALHAAEAASRMLAFERTVRLLRLAARYRGDPDEVSEPLAFALEAAGHGREAAQAYLRLGEAGDEEARARWTQRAAEQMLTSGEVEAGTELLHEVLRRVGVILPRGRSAAIAQIAGQRLLPSVFVRSAGAQEPEQVTLRRFDALRTASFGLGMTDNLFAALCHGRALVLARRERLGRRSRWRPSFAAPPALLRVSGRRRW